MRYHPHVVSEVKIVKKQLDNPHVLKTLGICFNLQVKLNWTLSAAEAFTFCGQRHKCVSFVPSPSFPSAGSHFRSGGLIFVCPSSYRSSCHYSLSSHLSVSISIFSSVHPPPSLCVTFSSACFFSVFLCSFFFFMAQMFPALTLSQRPRLSGPIALSL